MTKYEQELQSLKPHDPVQFTEAYKGYQFIVTAGHGYLIVPVTDKRAKDAKRICKYGFVGELAYYLEEDCEAGEFMSLETTNAPKSASEDTRETAKSFAMSDIGLTEDEADMAVYEFGF